MHTLDNLATTSPGRWARLRRDLRVAFRLVRMLFGYVVVGGGVRRALRRAARRGERYTVDHLARRATVG